MLTAKKYFWIVKRTSSNLNFIGWTKPVLEGASKTKYICTPVRNVRNVRNFSRLSLRPSVRPEVNLIKKNKRCPNKRGQSERCVHCVGPIAYIAYVASWEKYCSERCVHCVGRIAYVAYVVCVHKYFIFGTPVLDRFQDCVACAHPLKDPFWMVFLILDVKCTVGILSY